MIMAVTELTSSPPSSSQSPRRSRWGRSFSELALLSSPLSPTPAGKAAGSGRGGKRGLLASSRRNSEMTLSVDAPTVSIGSPRLRRRSTLINNVGVVCGGGCFKSQRSLLSPKKKVQFDSVSIREHAVILGSNPAVTCGPPIELSWETLSETVLPLDVYDDLRQGQRRTRRKQLLLPVDTRAFLLLVAGHSVYEIADATVQAQADKRLRYESAQLQNWERFEQAVEATGKTIRKMVKQRQRTELARTA